MERVIGDMESIKKNLLNGKCLVDLSTDVMEGSFFMIKDNKLFTCILDLDDEVIYDYDNEVLKISYEDVEKNLVEYGIRIEKWLELLEYDCENNLVNLYFL